MRRILVEHARARKARKRGGGDAGVTLSAPIEAPQPDPVDVLLLDEALDRLEAYDPRQARIVELSYFGGMTYPEVGASLGISEATVHRSLRHARAWLRRELAGQSA
jgi:RNA polymerase sigma-70 factor, ECF subfamily